MKKLFLGLGALALSIAAHATEFVEGDHYSKLPQRIATAPVTEVYSVYCPYCYKYERAVIPTIAATYGERFAALHLSSKGEFGATATGLLAVTKLTHPAGYQAAKMAWFVEIYEQARDFQNEAEFLEVGLKAAGLSREQYQAGLARPDVQALIAQWDAVAVPLAKQHGVPAILVNGQYQVKISRATSVDMLRRLIDFLLTQ
ncbi:MAG: DsbA family protein [Burkholderiaceae bacterium]